MKWTAPPRLVRAWVPSPGVGDWGAPVCTAVRPPGPAGPSLQTAPCPTRSAGLGFSAACAAGWLSAYTLTRMSGAVAGRVLGCVPPERGASRSRLGQLGGHPPWEMGLA